MESSENLLLRILENRIFIGALFSIQKDADIALMIQGLQDPTLDARLEAEFGPTAAKFTADAVQAVTKNLREILHQRSQW